MFHLLYMYNSSQCTTQTFLFFFSIFFLYIYIPLKHGIPSPLFPLPQQISGPNYLLKM